MKKTTFEQVVEDFHNVLSEECNKDQDKLGTIVVACNEGKVQISINGKPTNIAFMLSSLLRDKKINEFLPVAILANLIVGKDKIKINNYGKQQSTDTGTGVNTESL